MPGRKYCVSVKQTDGKRVKIQKRLILYNLKEAYLHFKILYPHMKLGFTKFSLLRLKECILADRHGTHTVCVCKIHQNFKLLKNSFK